MSLDALPEEARAMVVGWLPHRDTARLCATCWDWMLTCERNRDYVDHRDFMQMVWDCPTDDEDDQGCSCGCGAECDTFCYYDCYRDNYLMSR